MGQDPDQVGGVVGGQARPRDAGLRHHRSAGQLAHHQLHQRGEQHVAQHPLGQVERLAQALPLQVEAGAEPQARRPHAGDQRGGLQHDAQGGAQPQHPHLLVGERHRAVAGGAPDRQVQPQHGDADDVVEDRCPHHRPEPVAGVQHLPDQEERAEEEQLRHGQHRHQHQLLPVPRHRGLAPHPGRPQAHHLRCQHHRQRGDRQQQHHERCHDPVDECRPVVGVVLGVPDDLRHQHGVERAAGEQHVQRVGHERGQGERLDLWVGRPQHDHEQPGAQEPQHPADQGARGHHGGGVQQPSAGRLGRGRVRGGRGGGGRLSHGPPPSAGRAPS